MKKYIELFLISLYFALCVSIVITGFYLWSKCTHYILDNIMPIEDLGFLIPFICSFGVVYVTIFIFGSIILIIKYLDKLFKMNMFDDIIEKQPAPPRSPKEIERLRKEGKL